MWGRQPHRFSSKCRPTQIRFASPPQHSACDINSITHSYRSLSTIQIERNAFSGLGLSSLCRSISYTNSRVRHQMPFTRHKRHSIAWLREQHTECNLLYLKSTHQSSISTVHSFMAKSTTIIKRNVKIQPTTLRIGSKSLHRQQSSVNKTNDCWLKLSRCDWYGSESWTIDI